ncbi:arylamine N-acetyltransferase family protein [Fodinicola acaciae]|uniref:arylamine N-acetyltransferase family protein n=1 Tax=Fodinicola acaciae TaxID=2681555 RepID=UPI0013D75463|nr:arylamine N-acetyltransferase [Fodinicola acaciae]
MTEWDIDAVDLDAYLARIDHPRVSPSADALRSLQRAHGLTIPFENIDVLLGQHGGLAPDVIASKLIDRERGGYCYEHALLFAAVLEQLGFPVQRRIARVMPDRPGPRTHMMLAVRADDEDWLVDVGFGAGILHPFPFVDGAVVDQAGWKHRVVLQDGLWHMQKQAADGSWQSRHASDETSQRPIDYVVAHHYTSTHPKSPFTGRLVVMRSAEESLRELLGDQLTMTHPDGTVDRTTVPPDQLDETLRGLDIVLTPAELDALAVTYRGADTR